MMISQNLDKLQIPYPVVEKIAQIDSVQFYNPLARGLLAITLQGQVYLSLKGLKSPIHLSLPEPIHTCTCRGGYDHPMEEMGEILIGASGNQSVFTSKQGKLGQAIVDDSACMVTGSPA